MERLGISGQYEQKKGINMQVNTEMLWNVLKLMQLYIRRKEELLQDFERVLVQCKPLKKLPGYEELKQCEDAMREQIQRQKEMQYVLEKIIQNYEQTEQRLLRVQEEGIKPLEHTKISCINVAAIGCLLNQWNLIEEGKCK